MTLIAMFTWSKLVVLILAGFLIFKLAGCGFRSAPGFLLKSLGLLAVVAGIFVLFSRDDRHHEIVIEHPTPRSEIVHDIRFSDDFVRGDFVRPFADERIASDEVATAVPHVLFIVLGSGLIILGAILFGRERTRPFALKAVTWIGVGAILYSVVNYFGDPPRSESHARRAMVHHDHAAVLNIEKPSKVASKQRARRPGIRPLRPAPGETATDEFALPERAGEIPVTIDVAVEPKVSSKATEDAAVVETKPATESEVRTTIAGESSADAAPVETDKPSQIKGPAEKLSQPSTSAEFAKVFQTWFSPGPNDKPGKSKKAAEIAAKAATDASKITTAETIASEALVATTTDGGKRPAWVDAPASLLGSIYSITVNSGPHSSIPDCQRYLDDEIQSAADQYIDQYLGEENAALQVAIPLSYLKQHVKKSEYAEIVQSPIVGQMYQLHTRLEFDEQARADFQRRWRNAVVQDRLWYTGGGAALVLALLATFYGYLRLDLKTDSAHKGRLQLAATLVALIVAAGVLLARWAVPF